MNTLTLKIPEALDAALQAASAKRQVSKSAVVREALEKALADELCQAGSAATWLARWRGSLRKPAAGKRPDERVADILSKHAR
jgi:predicted transcriptional regulator